MRTTVDNVISQLASLESSMNPTDPVTNKHDILQQAIKNSGLSSKSKNNLETEELKKPLVRTHFVTLIDRGVDGSVK